MYTTPHAKLRFMERVKEKPLKNKKKFIENYLKSAFTKGQTPQEVKDKKIKDYMFRKLRDKVHNIKPTKITLYKDNFFLFFQRQCITILLVPEYLITKPMDIIYLNVVKTFIDNILEPQSIRNWLNKNSIDVIGDKKYQHDSKLLKIKYPDKLSYSWIMNNIPTRCIKYIFNDNRLKEIIKSTYDCRKASLNFDYVMLMSLLCLIPKNQIMKLQETLIQNGINSVSLIDGKPITQKQLDTCYKQLCILLGKEPLPEYDYFEGDNFTYPSIIYEFFELKIKDISEEIFRLFNNIKLDRGEIA